MSVPNSSQDAATEAAGSQNQGVSARGDAAAPDGQADPQKAPKADRKESRIRHILSVLGPGVITGQLMMTLQVLALYPWRVRSSDMGLFGQAW